MEGEREREGGVRGNHDDDGLDGERLTEEHQKSSENNQGIGIEFVTCILHLLVTFWPHHYYFTIAYLSIHCCHPFKQSIAPRNKVRTFTC